MIIHAKVAKLYKYLHDPEFSRVMRHIEAASDEALDSYELDLLQLDENIKFELIDALEAMGYEVVYWPEEDRLKVSLGD